MSQGHPASAAAFGVERVG
jgi:hypothetical protein